jgi:membrane-bound lytic murein transglycosylase MltF
MEGERIIGQWFRTFSVEYSNLRLFPLSACLCEFANIPFLILVLVFFTGPATASDKVDKLDSVEHVLKLDEKWTGDFDAMAKRRRIRALVTLSKTNYFLDGAVQRGITYEVLKKFEKVINKNLKERNLKTKIIFIPVFRDQLIPELLHGRGDIAAAALTATPERKNLIDFANPLLSDISEIIVTPANSPELTALDDLAGKEIHVRKSSSYYESLKHLNNSLKKAGKKQLIIKPADKYLEDEDLLEMVNAGIVPMTVVDDYLAKFWSQIFKNIKLHPKIALRTDGQIAWAIRKNSPKLKKVINDFVRNHKKGTLFGNIEFNRYLRNTKFVRNSLSDKDLERFRDTIHLFKKYAEKYDFDWLMIAALSYQESRIDQSKRSSAGAVGVMQLLPKTAAGDPVNIAHIEEIENNIHAGVKYLRWILDAHFKNEDMDQLNKWLFTFASYNAGTAEIKRLRKESSKMGLNPNIWFNNVEVVAAKRIGRETIQYVSHIYKYYVAYRLTLDEMNIKKHRVNRN